jgi:hypothetical protein
MFRLDKIFKMNRGKGPLPGKGEKVQKVSIIAAIFIGHDIFKKKGSAFKTLCDFEAIVTYCLIVRGILWSDPGRFQELHRIHQFSVKAEITWILKITILIFFSFPRGMAIMIDVFVIIRALP